MDRGEPPGRATVVVSRSLDARRDALRAYVVVLDGERVGKIRRGEKITVAVAPGRHVVRARIDWTGSPGVEFTASAGGHAAFSVGASGGPFRPDQLVGSGRYLVLERAD